MGGLGTGRKIGNTESPGRKRGDTESPGRKRGDTESPGRKRGDTESPSVRQSFSKTCINAFMVLGNVDRAPGTLNILIILW